MASPKSKIEWTDATWNPIRGCSRISEGCRHCYAEGIAARFSGPGLPYEGLAKRVNGEARWTGKLQLVIDNLHEPLHWRRPRRVFVNSMSDLFHENVPFAWVDQIFAVMALARQHSFQVLTKRADRMRAYFSDTRARQAAICRAAKAIDGMRFDHESDIGGCHWWPIKNIWLGASVEDQAAADARIPDLLATPAAVRFLSCEPLLGPVDITAIRRTRAEGFMRPLDGRFNRIDWVICGGESGSGAVRPMHPDWARSLRDQCAAAGVPFFFKQWGEWLPGDHAFDGDGLVAREVKHQAIEGQAPMSYGRVGKKAAARILDGRTWDEFPNLT